MHSTLSVWKTSKKIVANQSACENMKCFSFKLKWKIQIIWHKIGLNWSTKITYKNIAKQKLIKMSKAHTKITNNVNIN